MKNKQTYSILNIIYIILSIIGMFLLPFLSSKTWIGIYMLILLSFLIIGFVLLVLYHSLITKYQCPNCQQEFKLNFFQDLVQFTSKKVEHKNCPHCNKK